MFSQTLFLDLKELVEQHCNHYLPFRNEKNVATDGGWICRVSDRVEGNQQHVGNRKSFEGLNISAQKEGRVRRNFQVGALILQFSS